MSFWDWFWSAFVVVVGGGFAGFDYWRSTKHDGSTFSAFLRRVFHTDTKGGKVAFGAALGAFAVALWHHIDFGSWL